MTLLLTAAELQERREIAAGPLRNLTLSLAADLAPLVDRELFIPPEKALLSREGGRCPHHGVLLEFDPLSPRAHRCPVCGEVFSGELHYRFWIYWYQLWLAERATIAATLAAIGEGGQYARFARDILVRYAEQYASYPNQDNVLGPTRLFFSTYLESIWLLQICIALDLLALSGDSTVGGIVCDRIIEPSAAIIAGYDEHSSNRQVWNDAALFAAARLLGADSRIDEIVYGSSGIASHLAAGLLPDGSWYEGENYHLFAHRGLWYGLTMSARAGAELPEPLVARFDSGFTIPFATALPDMTMPSRRDSQYAISLRQWRIAEHTELGVARTTGATGKDNAALLSALARLYTSDLSRRDTGRWRSSADVERNEPASALSRSDLSWRALLHARPTLPAVDPAPPRSALLEGQGIAVFRRDEGRVYAAVDYGHSGGDHGHPDRLNLLLVDQTTRWLDDMGTGSYVDPSLHWYRSTIAHNAPLVNGRSQTRVHGRLLAYDERGAAGWIWAAAEEIAPGTSVARTIVVMPTYLVDEVEWRGDGRVKLDLPVHVDAQIVRGATALHDDQPSGSTGLEDGFRFLESAAMQRADAGETIELHASQDHRDLRIWWRTDARAEWWRAKAPGPPGRPEQYFRFVRATGDRGSHRSIWSWADDVAAVDFGDDVVVAMKDGTVHMHHRTESGWQVQLTAGSSRSSIDLGGLAPEEVDAAALQVLSEPQKHEGTPEILRIGSEYVVDLGEAHYRRSEQSWTEAGRPSGSVVVSWTGAALRIVVTVDASDLTFVPADARNQYDNESMDINGDGVQLYLRIDERESGWLLVPQIGASSVRIRPIEGWSEQRPIAARWHRSSTGYTLEAELRMEPRSQTVRPQSPSRLGAIELGLDVVINEKPSGRERRRGQLVMSGARDEFVYLRGDRHDRWRLVPFTLLYA